MQNNRSMELDGYLELPFKNLSRNRRDVFLLQSVESNFSDSQAGIRNQAFAKGCLIPHPPSLIPRFPRMHADEVASDQELAHRRIAARHMTVRVGHSSLFPLPSSLIALKRSFNAILIDSVAMPAVIFE